MSQKRINDEREYWDKNALDPEVDEKYISDFPAEDCWQDIKNATEIKGRVLEIGCGVGRLMKPGFSGIDISQNMLDIAQERNKSFDLRITRGRNIPYPDNEFDVIYSFLVFQHLKPEGVQAYIDEAHRTLKIEGVLVFQFVQGDEREPYSNHYSKKELRNMLARFSKVSFSPSVTYKGWTICKATK